jgi:hypothetical protein
MDLSSVGKIELSFAESVNQIFHHNINLGTKLKPGTEAGCKPGLKLILGGRFLEIYYQGNYSALERSALAHWIPKDPKLAGFTIYDEVHKNFEKQQPFHKEPVVAQVETPHMKVQEPPKRRSLKDPLP